MFVFSNNTHWVQCESDLPNLKGAKTLYIDCETGSGDTKVSSLNPWHSCFVVGICITVDDDPRAFYVPVRHYTGPNLCRETVIRWLKEIMDNAEVLINQNVKYDLHVLENDFGIPFRGHIIDTLTLAKTFESDRLSYSLEDLSEHFLGDDIDHLKKALEPYTHTNGKRVNKDYSRIPPDVMAEYGGQDVLTTRRLYKYFRQLQYDSQAFGIEEKVTPVLYRIENEGMHISPRELKIMNLAYIKTMLWIEERLLDITGYNMRPHVADDCYDVLCNQYGLPVLKWTNEEEEEKESNPSFAKDVMAKYLIFPGAPTEVIKLITKYRTMNHFNGLFLEAYQDLHLDGVLHPDYNQAVRTGRMSCKSPNAQQLNKIAKRLIKPPPGHSFFSVDYSQIEFRLIAHYIKDDATIRAYNENADTDFHTWVAELCGIPRKPAKNVNFCMGYGGGQAKLLAMLSNEATLVGSIRDEVDKLGLPQDEAVEVFKARALARAKGVYESYHAALPTLKSTSKMAERVARSRGYVQNLVGRRRYLGRKRAHIAFNALNQSTAADIMKERLPFIEDAAFSHGLKLVAIVHDEVLFHGPTRVVEDPRVQRDIIGVMEAPKIPMRVPVRCSFGWSNDNWAACTQEQKWPLDDSPWIGQNA